MSSDRKIISRFTGEYAFLSNFYPVTILYMGEAFRSVEHAYQASKTDDPEWHRRIRDAATSGKAKVYGRRAPMKPEWKEDETRLRVMEEILRLKFSISGLRRKLNDTKPCELVEGNFWRDRFWGVYEGEGENYLGKLLMKIRDGVPEE